MKKLYKPPNYNKNKSNPLSNNNLCVRGRSVHWEAKLETGFICKAYKHKSGLSIRINYAS